MASKKDGVIKVKEVYVYSACNKCGVRIYVTKEKQNILETKKEKHWCVNGHCQYYK